MSDQNRAYLLASIAVLFWSTAASAFKISLNFIHYPLLLLLSSITASIVLLIIILIKGEFTKFISVSGKDLLNSLFLGFLNPFLYYIILFKAYSLIPAQQAQPLNFVWPIMLVLLSIPILKQKIKVLSILALIICFVGVVIISTQGDLRHFKLSDPLGVSLALISSLVWAFFWIRNMKDRRDELHKLTLSFIFGSILTFIYIISVSNDSTITLNGILGSVYIGIFEMGITFYIWLRALKLSRTTAEVNSLIYLTPLLALVFIKFFVGEVITSSTLLGVFLIILGIVINNSINKKSR